MEGWLPVALDHPVKGGLGAPVGGGREQHPVGDLGPDEQAEAVGHLVIARVLDLDVDAQAVEPQRLGLACLVFQELHAGHRVDGFGIVGLVEHAAQVDRLPVEIDAAVTRLDGAEAAGIAVRVLHLAACAQRGFDAVQVGRIRAPQGRGARKPGLAVPRRVQGCLRHLVAVGAVDHGL